MLDATDVRDIGIHACSRWLFNCYVIADGGSGRPFVVDPGLPITTRDAARLLARLRLPLAVRSCGSTTDQLLSCR